MLEAEQAGFGASGRNGGWVSGFFSGPARAYARGARAGGEGYEALQRAMFATVAEVGDAIAEERIEADLVHGGNLTVALDRAQLARLREALASARADGIGRGGPARARRAVSSPSACAWRARSARASPRTSRACTR